MSTLLAIDGVCFFICSAMTFPEYPKVSAKWAYVGLTFLITAHIVEFLI